MNDLFVKYQNFTVQARNLDTQIIFAKSLASEAVKILLCPFYTWFQAQIICLQVN